MILCFRGSVNRWECDENDHLNVRWYVEKHWQALSAGWSSLGFALPADGLGGRIRKQHLRFLQESRIATPLSGYVGVVGSTIDRIEVLTELRHSLTDEVLCSVVSELEVDAADTHQMTTEPLPSTAGPRGIADQDLPIADAQIEQIKARGFRTIGMGSIQPYECDAAGNLSLYQYMGRLSDSMPHLWASALDVRQWQADGGEEGGAVLEYRMRYHSVIKLGEPFEVVSGVVDVGPKVQRFAHLMYATGEAPRLCLSSESVGVRMDLKARKAKTLDEERLAQLRAVRVEL